jgi:hypothetical protein
MQYSGLLAYQLNKQFLLLADYAKRKARPLTKAATQFSRAMFAKRGRGELVP